MSARLTTLALVATLVACGPDGLAAWRGEPVDQAPAPCPYGEVERGGTCWQDVRIDLAGVELVPTYRVGVRRVAPTNPFATWAQFNLTVTNMGHRAVGLRWGVHAIGQAAPRYVPVGEPPRTEVPAVIEPMQSHTGTVTIEVLDDSALWRDMGLLVQPVPGGGQFATRGWGLSKYQRPGVQR